MMRMEQAVVFRLKSGVLANSTRMKKKCQNWVHCRKIQHLQLLSGMQMEMKQPAVENIPMRIRDIP